MNEKISEIIQQLNQLLNPQINLPIMNLEFQKIATILGIDKIQIVVINVDVSILFYNKKLKEIIAEKNEAINEQKFEYAALLRDKEKRLANSIDSLKPVEQSHFLWKENCIIYKANICNTNEIILVDLVKKFQTSYYN